MSDNEVCPKCGEPLGLEPFHGGWMYHLTNGVSCLAAQLAALRAENLRMREALEYFVNIQAHIAGPESSLLSSTARIARSALSVRHHRRGECDCELCEPPRRDV
jgi:hypothetical protein